MKIEYPNPATPCIKTIDNRVLTITIVCFGLVMNGCVLVPPDIEPVQTSFKAWVPEDNALLERQHTPNNNHLHSQYNRQAIRYKTAAATGAFTTGILEGMTESIKWREKERTQQVVAQSGVYAGDYSYKDEEIVADDLSDSNSEGLIFTETQEVQ